MEVTIQKLGYSRVFEILVWIARAGGEVGMALELYFENKIETGLIQAVGSTDDAPSGIHGLKIDFKVWW